MTDKPEGDPRGKLVRASEDTRRSPREIADQKPPGWEYLLFTEILFLGKQHAELRWRDHTLGITRHNYQKIEEENAHRIVFDAFGELSWLLKPMQRVFDAQEDAFGAPGTAGDPLLIEHFADWILHLYCELLDWASRLRSLDAGDKYDRAFELAAHVSDEPLSQIRDFIDDTQRSTAALPAHLALPKEQQLKTPLEISLTLTISLDESLMDEVMAEVRGAVSPQSE